MENKFSGNYFQLTVCFNGFDSEIGFSQNFHFKPFPDSRAKREREKREPSPQTELQPDDHRSSSSTMTHTPPILSIAASYQSHQIASVSSIAVPCQLHRADQAKINSNAARSRLHHTTSPSHPPHDLTSRSNPVASLSSFFSQFDQI